MCQALNLWPGRKYEKQGGPTASAVANLIKHHSQRPQEDLRAFAQALIFNWLTCGTDAHARNYSLLLSAGAVRLAPLYDLNSFLADTDGVGTELSMSTGGCYRADRLTTAEWIRVAPTLLIDPGWLGEEIDRQRSALPAAIDAAAMEPDVSRYDSPAIERLVSHLRSWLGRLR